MKNVLAIWKKASITLTKFTFQRIIWKYYKYLTHQSFNFLYGLNVRILTSTSVFFPFNTLVYQHWLNFCTWFLSELLTCATILSPCALCSAVTLHTFKSMQYARCKTHSKRGVKEISHNVTFPPTITSSDLKSNVYIVVDSTFRVSNLFHFYLNFIHKNGFYLLISKVVKGGVQFFY